jgi:hypothetical protein
MRLISNGVWGNVKTEVGNNFSASYDRAGKRSVEHTSCKPILRETVAGNILLNTTTTRLAY